MKKFKVWLFLSLHFLAMFLPPILAAYFMFAIHLDGVGGSFFYFVSAIIFVVLFKRLGTAVKTMKASIPKEIFKAVLAIAVLMVTYGFVNYVGVNFTELGNLILITIAGRILAFIFSSIAIKIDSEMVNEIGVI